MIGLTPPIIIPARIPHHGKDLEQRNPRFTLRSSPIQASQSPAQYAATISLRGPEPSSSRGMVNPFAPIQGIPHR